MKRKLIYTFEEDLAKRLKDPKFKKAWKESEPEYLLACQLIEYRMKKKISQRTFAKKVKTTQAIISHLESMSANPTLDLLKRIADVFGSKLTLRFR